jgi:purine-binding chemotaxis protein CheW
MPDHMQKPIEQASLRWITFGLGAELYGVDVMRVREVLRSMDITPVPGAPIWVLGIINLRGNVVTVIDTRRRFGLAIGESTEASRILVVELESEVVGFLVDRISDVRHIQPEQVEAAPHLGRQQPASYILGIANHADDLVILVDLASVARLAEAADSAPAAEMSEVVCGHG